MWKKVTPLQVGVASVVVLVAAVCVEASLSRKPSPYTVTDTCVRHGWYAVPCDKLGNDRNSCFYTREPRLWDGLASLRKGEDFRRDWDGVLFVTRAPRPENAGRWPDDMQATGRGVWVYGDPVMVREFTSR